ncbi:uncharacterized protein DSM5745_10456 [Aspergillus mulundensis]|uniref:Uncharacterized protein n=1 Tax=Aspergillus mulundensis TaxID=1810919 RepID=A0A3D8QK26_9EURO|nr:hypothetical protein DSM5745_10456 [Aspergillus mulundensis]RDW61784.1 hypothetical protein DSM5745_10456 [Aspergillus mulundensis]
MAAPMALIILVLCCFLIPGFFHWLLMLLLRFLGFGPLGPVANSWAAFWQSFFGPIARGSLFAFFQSLAMNGHAWWAVVKGFAPVRVLAYILGFLF